MIPSLDLVVVRNGGRSPSDSSPNVRAWNDDSGIAMLRARAFSWIRSSPQLAVTV